MHRLLHTNIYPRLYFIFALFMAAILILGTFLFIMLMFLISCNKLDRFINTTRRFMMLCGVVVAVSSQLFSLNITAMNNTK